MVFSEFLSRNSFSGKYVSWLLSLQSQYASSACLSSAIVALGMLYVARRAGRCRAPASAIYEYQTAVAALREHLSTDLSPSNGPVVVSTTSLLGLFEVTKSYLLSTPHSLLTRCPLLSS